MSGTRGRRSDSNLDENPGHEATPPEREKNIARNKWMVGSSA